MGFLDRLKASKGTQIDSWKMLNNIEQLNEIDQLSVHRPVVIFKHSTSCGISAGAKYRLESDWENISEEFDFYYLDLLSFRHISHAIATRYNIRHESPQIMVVKNGHAIYNTSHHKISIGDLNKVTV